jgi:hypothetical protein
MAEQRGIDLFRWKCISWEGRDWEGFSRNKTTQEVEKTTLQYCKAKWELNVEANLALDEIQRLAKAAVIPPKKFSDAAKPDPHSDNIVILSVSDLHLGKPGVSEETGCAPYTLELTESLFYQATTTLLTRTSIYKPKEIVFVVGNDFLHIDNPDGMTSNGTKIDYDGRYYSNFLKGFHMLEAAINMCREYAPKVTVVVVPGNHDATSMWHMGHSLDLAYSTTPSVSVLNQPVNRKYYTWGQCAFMFAHGDAPKSTNYAQIFAADQGKIWGRTKFHEVLLGHQHKTQVDEFPGCIVRRLSSLTPSDVWHSKNFYIGRQQRAEALVYSAAQGLLGTAVFSPKD